MPLQARLTTNAVALLACGAWSTGLAAQGEPFGWLAGRWCLEAQGQLVEELWLPARGGIALGLSRTVEADKTVSFEYLRIERSATATQYLAQPQGRPATAFALTASGADWARFENPAHDFPQRIEYRRDGDRLHASVAGPGADGKDTTLRFDYARCDN
jgi:hypothetical protein